MTRSCVVPGHSGRRVREHALPERHHREPRAVLALAEQAAPDDDHRIVEDGGLRRHEHGAGPGLRLRRRRSAIRRASASTSSRIERATSCRPESTRPSHSRSRSPTSAPPCSTARRFAPRARSVSTSSGRSRRSRSRFPPLPRRRGQPGPLHRSLALTPDAAVQRALRATQISSLGHCRAHSSVTNSYRGVASGGGRTSTMSSTSNLLPRRSRIQLPCVE